MRDIKNVNLLSPNKFSLVIERFPHVTWFSQRANIPGVSIMATPVNIPEFVDYTVPGDKIIYEDFIIGILVDENLQVYKEIVKWMRESIGKPLFSDMTLKILTNNSNENLNIKLFNAYPYSISPTLLDSSVAENSVLSTDVYFKYSHYDFE